MPKFSKGESAPEHFYPDVDVGDEIDIDFETDYPAHPAEGVETALAAAGWIGDPPSPAAVKAKAKAKADEAAAQADEAAAQAAPTSEEA